MTYDYAQRQVEQGQASDLTLIWFNVLKFNTTDASVFEAAFRDSDADVIMLTEVRPVLPVLEALRDVYPYQTQCFTAPLDCGLVVLSGLPLQNVTLRDMAAGHDRIAIFTLHPTSDKSLDVVSVHMSKPWYSAFNNRDHITLYKAIRKDRGQPLIVLGDEIWLKVGDGP